MAEGVEVEIPRSVIQKYFCHACSLEFTNRYSDLTCTRCQSEFVEEITDYNDRSDDSDVDFEPEAFFAQEQEDPFRRLIRRTIAHTIYDFDQRDSSINSPARSLLQEWLRFHGGMYEERVPSASRDDSDDDVGLNFFRELLLARNLGDIGDYAIGLEWDEIITQLLNESEVNGPPPLGKDEIQAIPLVSVQEEHILKNIQCTVCMEDFKLNEIVRNLPCEHFYHPECIEPWLERHATCPVCRKQINESKKDQSNQRRVVTLSDIDSSSSSSASSGSSNLSTTSTSSNSTTTTSTSDSSSATTSDSYQSSSSSSPADSSYDMATLHFLREI